MWDNCPSLPAPSKDYAKKKKRNTTSAKNLKSPIINHLSIQVGSYQEKSEGKKSKWADKSEKKELSDKKDCSSPHDSANKSEGIWKLTSD
jgi:hypothetical protein